MLKNGTKLTRVEMSFAKDKKPEDEEWVNEIGFYTESKSKEERKRAEYREILRSCDPSQMFDNLSELIEDPGKVKEDCQMPVRKFYNNTFNTLLNRAIFTLTKKQS